MVDGKIQFKYTDSRSNQGWIEVRSLSSGRLLEYINLDLQDKPTTIEIPLYKGKYDTEAYGRDVYDYQAYRADPKASGIFQSRKVRDFTLPLKGRELKSVVLEKRAWSDTLKKGELDGTLEPGTDAWKVEFKKAQFEKAFWVNPLTGEENVCFFEDDQIVKETEKKGKKQRCAFLCISVSLCLCVGIDTPDGNPRIRLSHGTTSPS